MAMGGSDELIVWDSDIAQNEHLSCEHDIMAARDSGVAFQMMPLRC